MSPSREITTYPKRHLAPEHDEHVRSIGFDIVLTLITCGLFNFFVQYKQMRAINAMLQQERYHFLPWLLLTFVTCGLYHIYHEYRKSTDVARALGDESSNEGLIALILSVFGLVIVVDAIQQSQINRYFGSEDV